MDGVTFDQQMSDLVAQNQPRKVVQLFLDWKANKITGAPPFAPSLMSYNLFLLGCARHSGVNLSVMLSAIDSMVKDHNLVPTAMTYNAVLRHCSRTIKASAANQVMTRMINEGVVPNATSYTNAVGAMIAGGEPLMALKVLKEMRASGYLKPGPSSGVDPKHVYTDLLQLLFRRRLLGEVKEVLEYMVEDDCAPQPFLLGETLAAAADADDDALGLLVVQLLSKLLAEAGDTGWWKMSQGEALAVIITASRMGNVQLAEATLALLQWDPQASPPFNTPLLPILHSMVECYVRAKRLQDAFAMMSHITTAYPHSDLSTSMFSLVVEAVSTDVGAIDKAYYLLVEMHQTGVPVCTAAVNVVIAGCVRIGDMDRAFETMLELQRMFMLKATVETYDTLMAGCAMNSQPETTFLLADEMKAGGLKFSADTFAALICANIVLKKHQEAYNVVLEISDTDVLPTRDSVMRLMLAFRREGQVQLLVDLKRLLVLHYGQRELRSSYNRRRMGRLIAECGDREVRYLHVASTRSKAARTEAARTEAAPSEALDCP